MSGAVCVVNVVSCEVRGPLLHEGAVRCQPVPRLEGERRQCDAWCGRTVSTPSHRHVHEGPTRRACFPACLSIRRRLETTGLSPSDIEPEAFDAFCRAEYLRCNRLIREARTQAGGTPEPNAFALGRPIQSPPRPPQL